MNPNDVTDIARSALLMSAELAGPILLAALVVGLLVSLIQAVTQMQEVTLTFVPKVLVISAVLAFGGHWMLMSLVAYTENLFNTVPHLLGA